MNSRFIKVACICIAIGSLGFENLESQSGETGTNGAKIGDPGWMFDASRADSDYLDMEKWASAGVRGGLPFTQHTGMSNPLPVPDRGRRC